MLVTPATLPMLNMAPWAWMGSSYSFEKDSLSSWTEVRLDNASPLAKRREVDGRASPALGATPRAGGHPEGSGVFQKDFPLRAVLRASSAALELLRRISSSEPSLPPCRWSWIAKRTQGKGGAERKGLYFLFRDAACVFRPYCPLHHQKTTKVKRSSFVLYHFSCASCQRGTDKGNKRWHLNRVAMNQNEGETYSLMRVVFCSYVP